MEKQPAETKRKSDKEEAGTNKKNKEVEYDKEEEVGTGKNK